MTCISGPPWRPGKTAESSFLAQLLLAQDDPAARAAQGLVRGGRDEVGHRHGARDAGRAATRPGDVRHVDEEDRADLAGDLGDPVEVDRPRIGAGAGQDQLRLVLAGQRGELVVVDPLGLGVDAVADRRDTSGPRSSASCRASGGRPGPGPSPGRCRRSRGARSRRPGWPTRPSAAGRWRARRRRAALARSIASRSATSTNSQPP